MNVFHRFDVRGLAGRIALSLVAAAAAWVVAEASLRLLLGPTDWYGDRVLFFSRDNWEIDDTGAPRYVPNSTIRAVSFYGTHAEFDIRFRTNNLGYVDDEDYPLLPSGPVSRRIAMVGDSFTAGFHAGDPWVPRLRDRARAAGSPVVLYNFGVGATGLAQFGGILTSAARFVDFDEIAVLFISADLYRPPWYHLQTDDAIFICALRASTERCQSRTSRIRITPEIDTPVEQLIEIADAADLLSREPGLGSWLTRNTMTGSRLARWRSQRESVDWRDMKDWDVEAPCGLRRTFPGVPIRFVHLPEKAEVLNRTPRVDPSAALERCGIDYTALLDTCPLTLADYYAIDGHPNAEGYRKLGACVGEALRLLPEGAPTGAEGS